MSTEKFIGSFDLSMIPSIDEFDKRYAQSYMLVKTPKVEDVFFYDGYSGDHCIFRNDVYGEIRINHHTNTNISPIFPKVGLFNSKSKNAVLFTCKVPVRQNRRSMSDKNTKFEDPILTAYRSLRRTLAIDFPLIREAMFPVFPERMEESIFLVTKKGVVADAFSPDYMVTMGHKEGDALLWNKAVPVGYIKGNVIQIDSHYAQEMKDYVRDNQENYVVEELH